MKLTFYKLTSDDKLIKLETDKVKPYTEIQERLLKTELSESDNEIVKKSGILSKENIIIDLPRFGKEIKVKFGWDEIDGKERYIARKECSLIWENYRLIIKN